MHRFVTSPAPVLAVALVLSTAFSAAGQVARWSLAERPTVSIGDGRGQGHELLWVRDATVLADGRIAVINGGTREIRVFNRDSSLERLIGRQGEGPGEYLIPEKLREVEPGTLIVSDLGNQRLTWVTTAGIVLDTRRIPYPLGVSGIPSPHHRPLARGLLPLATTQRSLWSTVTVPEGLSHDTVVINIHEGPRLVPIARRLGAPEFTVRDGALGLTKPIPFGPVLLRATGRDLIVLGSSHGRTFDALAPDGKVVGDYRLVGELRRPSRRDWADYEKWFRSVNDTPLTLRGVTSRPSGNVDRFLDRAPHGDFLPLFDRIHLDDYGRLWVRQYSVVNTSTVWQVATLEEGTIARLELPSTWEVLEFGKSSVLVLERGEYDVEIVRLYDLIGTS